MNALVSDTSSWISYFDGTGSALVEAALEDGKVFLPPLVAAELMSGTLSRREQAALEGLFAELPLIEAPLDHWVRVGQLRAALRSKGVAVSTPDAHVAQCALDLGARLLTEDGIFRHIAHHAGLKLA